MKNDSNVLWILYEKKMYRELYFTMYDKYVYIVFLLKIVIKLL